MDKARQKYFRERIKRLVAFEVADPELRERMKAVAEADGRSLNGWISHYIIPEIQRHVEAQEAAAKKPRR